MPSRPIYPTPQALLADTGLTPTAAGRLHYMVDGNFYEEAASSASNHDATSAGGAKLYYRGSGNDAGNIGASDAANPSGRGTFAPALVTSMQTRRLRGVSLRELLGRNYNGETHDGAATLNSYTTELAPAGIAITDPDAITVRADEAIFFRDDLKMFLSPGTIFKKAFDNNGNNGGMFANAVDWETKVNRVHIRGGVFQSLEEHVTGSGKLVTIRGDDWTIEGTRFQQWWGGQGMTHAGNRNRILNTRHFSTITEEGHAPLRMMGGSGFRGIGIVMQGGDDQLQFVPSTNPSATGYDLDITDSYFIGCTARSLTSRAFVAVIAGLQNLNQNSCVIRRVGWIGCYGAGVNRSAIVENQEGDGSSPRQIDDVLIAGCTIDGQYESLDIPHSLLLDSMTTEGVGRVTIRDTQMINSPRDYAIRLANDVQELVMDNLTARGSVSVLNIGAGAATRISGRNLRFLGGSNHTISADGSAGAWSMNLDGYNHFAEVANGKDAIRINGTGTQVVQRGTMRIDRANGATGVDGIFAGSGNTIDRDVIDGTFDGVAVRGSASHRILQVNQT